MNQQIKAKWVAALRGQGPKVYKQGTYYLRQNDCFCAYGVLCDILFPDDWEATEEVEDTTVYQLGWSCAAVPPIVIKKAELPKLRSNDDWLLRPEAIEVVNMNDNAINPKTFPEIADYIEKTL